MKLSWFDLSQIAVCLLIAGDSSFKLSDKLQNPEATGLSVGVSVFLIVLAIVSLGLTLAAARKESAR